MNGSDQLTAEQRIVLTPTWAKLIDFDTTLPRAVEELIRQRAERHERLRDR